MPRFTIRVHYYPGSAILGTVVAEDKHQALTLAEDMGLLDDPDAVDYTATEIKDNTK